MNGRNWVSRREAQTRLTSNVSGCCWLQKNRSSNCSTCVTWRWINPRICFLWGSRALFTQGVGSNNRWSRAWKRDSGSYRPLLCLGVAGLVLAQSLACMSVTFLQSWNVGSGEKKKQNKTKLQSCRGTSATSLSCHASNHFPLYVCIFSYSSGCCRTLSQTCRCCDVPPEGLQRRAPRRGDRGSERRLGPGP